MLFEIGASLEKLREDISELKQSMTGQTPAVREAPVYSPNYVDIMEEDAEEVVDAEIRPMREVERVMIRRALQMTGGNRKQAAKLLEIPERTFYRKLDKHGLGSSKT